VCVVERSGKGAGAERSERVGRRKRRRGDPKAVVDSGGLNKLP